jgi:hypothetical protein
MTCSTARAEWVVAGTALKGEITFYYDKSTKRKNGSLVKMWLMQDHSVVQTDLKKMYQSSKLFLAFDCTSETTAIISLVHYSGSMGAGAVVFSHTENEKQLQWDPVVPDSNVAEIWSIACSRK